MAPRTPPLLCNALGCAATPAQAAHTHTVSLLYEDRLVAFAPHARESAVTVTQGPCVGHAWSRDGRVVAVALSDALLCFTHSRGSFECVCKGVRLVGEPKDIAVETSGVEGERVQVAVAHSGGVLVHRFQVGNDEPAHTTGVVGRFFSACCVRAHAETLVVVALDGRLRLFDTPFANSLPASHVAEEQACGTGERVVDCSITETGLVAVVTWRGNVSLFQLGGQSLQVVAQVTSLELSPPAHVLAPLVGRPVPVSPQNHFCLWSPNRNFLAVLASEQRRLQIHDLRDWSVLHAAHFAVEPRGMCAVGACFICVCTRQGETEFVAWPLECIFKQGEIAELGCGDWGSMHTPPHVAVPGIDRPVNLAWSKAQRAGGPHPTATAAVVLKRGDDAGAAVGQVHAPVPFLSSSQFHTILQSSVPSLWHHRPASIHADARVGVCAGEGVCCVWTERTVRVGRSGVDQQWTRFSVSSVVRQVALGKHRGRVELWVSTDDHALELFRWEGENHAAVGHVWSSPSPPPPHCSWTWLSSPGPEGVVFACVASFGESVLEVRKFVSPATEGGPVEDCGVVGTFRATSELWWCSGLSVACQTASATDVRVSLVFPDESRASDTPLAPCELGACGKPAERA